MNRELKFRAWNNEQKKFECFELHNITVPDRMLIQDEFPVQQITGLKDSKGVDVYEGDFLDDSRFPITFNNGKFVVVVSGARIFDLEEFFEEYIKPTVKGNIFENSELLKNDS